MLKMAEKYMSATDLHDLYTTRDDVNVYAALPRSER